MAELALAIVPIFLSACQGFVLLHGKIVLFRHYKREVKWLRRKVDVQARCYKSEIHHLVIDTLDDDKPTAESMIADHKHAYWTDPNLETTFKQYMGDLFDEFLLAVQDVHEALAKIEDELSVLAPPDHNTPRFKATKDKVRLAFKKPEYQEHIDELKESIQELRRVRKEAAARSKKSIKSKERRDKERRDTLTDLTTLALAVHNDTVRQCGAIRSFSSSFQTYLQEQWTCCNQSHSSHKGTLFLSCAPERRRSVAWLLESSGIDADTNKLSSRHLFNVVSQPPGLLTPDSETRTFEDLDIRSPKRPRLSPQPVIPPTCPPAQQGLGLLSANNSLPSLCKQLETATINPNHHDTLICADARHQEFYKFETRQVQSITPSSKTPNIFTTISTWDLHETKSFPLSQLLAFKPEYVMLHQERIRLAAGLVRATLMAHSTPGWPGQQNHHQLPLGCLLEQISFLSQESADISAGVNIDSLLNTLNIPITVGSSTQASKTIPSSNSDAEMTDAGDINKSTDHSSDPVSSEEDLKNTYGIPNLILYRLGVALLSIALWKPIPWQNITSVRRKARALDWGGSDYKCAVLKLINGDFGLGRGDLDLEKEDVQIEIVRNIVGPLDSIVGFISRRPSQGGGVLSRENLQAAQSGQKMWLPEPERWVGSVPQMRQPPPPPYPGPSTWVGSPGGMDGGDGGFETTGLVESP